MDIDDFAKTMKPTAKKSRLAPFKAQLLELKKRGFANWQLVEFLKKNGVTVSAESVRKFLLKAGTEEPEAKAEQQEKPKNETTEKPKGALQSKNILGDLESKKKPFSAIPNVAELTKLSDSAIKDKGDKK